ncbi:MAG: hypothetical protein M3R04_00540 [bacterium]|nr:hypothetical protein [bacterium]
MACLRLYGDPTSRENAERVLAGYGANFEVGSGGPDGELLRRVISKVPNDESVDAQIRRVMHDPQKLAELVSSHPELLRKTLVVRGGSYMFGNDPARLQSLMY